ncbi:MAG: hypothetical protein M1819_001006 [Sarea resinae]|nr:MAG: hypothetical protein M1819_001006 [Sarea resinae]
MSISRANTEHTPISGDAILLSPGSIDVLTQQLASIVAEVKYHEIWGVDLRKGDPTQIRTIMVNYLSQSFAIPELQVLRARKAIVDSLWWRKRQRPHMLIARHISVLTTLNLVHITYLPDSYVMWTTIDEKTMKRYSLITEELRSESGLVGLCISAIESLIRIMFEHYPASSDLKAIHVLECRPFSSPDTRPHNLGYRSKLSGALRTLITVLCSHYPHTLRELYIISPDLDFLATLPLPDAIAPKLTILTKKQDLAVHLGSKVPSDFGGNGASLIDSDILRSHKGYEESGHSNVPTHNQTEVRFKDTEGTNDAQEVSEEPTKTGEDKAPRLIYSDKIGPPDIILDPKDLESSAEMCPNKMGARLVHCDSDMVVKFGLGVRLAEAEAMHLVSNRTTIPIPRLLSAYILDGTCYIIMSYESGEPLNRFWDKASKQQRESVIDQLRDSVRQMRAIKGDFIGGVDESPCRDALFEAGWADEKHTYGPFSSEKDFNEGIIQALEDRLPPEVRDSPRDPQSSFEISEYINRQTVRGLKGHEIVFTHGDLAYHNILVREDGTVVIIDWGLAGFWPAYWEFYRAMFNPGWKESWDLEVEKFVPPYYVEWATLKRTLAIMWG